jgi:proteic killer suppression protein
LESSIDSITSPKIAASLGMLRSCTSRQKAQLGSNGTLFGSAPCYAVTITRNVRITFGWNGEDAIEVDLEDHHGR